MKIDVRRIFYDHLATLYNAENGKVSLSDLLTFYAFPVVVGFVCFLSNVMLSREVYNLSITFFGIFIGLLLNIQVAIFAIFQRKWSEPNDRRLAQKRAKKAELRRRVMAEINANISYLVLFCCIALVFLFVCFVRNWDGWLAPAVVVFMYAHFLLTLVMIVKRSHALFHSEYLDP